jgi:hypothetical protein
VLAGRATGRQSDRDITVFDSTGLTIEDVAIALAATKRADELDLAKFDLYEVRPREGFTPMCVPLRSRDN